MKHTVDFSPYQQELDVTLEAVLRAGREIEEIAKGGFETTYKENHDPLTTADLRCNEIVRSALQQAFPEDGWLSEETRDDPARLDKRRVWIVDPIDGTREFTEHVPQYAVSVALVEDGQPVLGVIYNPAADELYYAVRGKGTWYRAPGTDEAEQSDIAAVEWASSAPNGDGAAGGAGKPVILASRSEVKRGDFSAFEADFEIVPIGSIAYKLAMVSAGKAIGTFSVRPKNEWDIAAGVLLVQEAGGSAVDLHLQPFTFNQRDTLVAGSVACAPAGEPFIHQQIRNHITRPQTQEPRCH